MFTFTPQEIPDVLLLEHKLFEDSRGYFTETFRAGVFEQQGIPPLLQENHSRSTQGVLRGLHYQREPASIGKLVRCIRGRIFDVAVDIRQGSPTYSKWVGVELDEDRPAMLWVPPGFAHGFCALSEKADICYKQTGYYSPDHDRGILWNDPAIAIKWPLDSPILSPKDTDAPALADADNNFRYQR